MDRNQVIKKIQSMMKLQESTDFAGEATAAAKLIDKLCKQHGIDLTEASNPVADDEQFGEVFKRMNHSYGMVLNAVAKYYDAYAYIVRGREQYYKVIGTEAQRIQVQLYFEYLWEVCEREADRAYRAEKVIAHLQDKNIDRSFKSNFKKAFASTVADRLFEMKKENEEHEHKGAVQSALSTRRFSSGRTMRGPKGSGASAGAGVGAGVSLTRQASGSASRRALVGV